MRRSALLAKMAAQQAYPKPMKAARKAAKKKEKEARMQNLQEIREAVYKRSWGSCENPMCQRKLDHQTGGEFDHWLGGNGRRRQKEGIETIWLLCSDCHAARTANLPNAAAWNLRWELHCERYGYPFVPHVTNDP